MSLPVHPFAVRPRDIWSIAIPASIAFITEPVAGLIDTAVIGQLGDAGLLGGLTLGVVAFNVIFALAFFLRYGTAGLTAQSVGARDPLDGLLHLARAMLMALAMGVVLVALTWPIYLGFAASLAPPPDSADAFADYMFVRMVSVPFVLINYVLLGWFYGRAAARTGMALQILINVVNIGLSLWLVFGFNLGVPGVAWATVAGQACAAVAGLWLAFHHYGGVRATLAKISPADLGDIGALRRMLGISRDLIIRSLALTTAFAYFAAQGARVDEVALSANAILLQLYAIASYFLDGIATAAEQLSGKAVGARWRPAFESAQRLSLGLGMIIAIALAILLFAGGWLAIDLITTSPAVRQTAKLYLPVAALTPVTGLFAFVYDGIMIGATLNATMRNGMLASLAIYILIAIVLQPVLGLWGLWIALHVLLLVRAGIYALAIENRKDALFS